MHEYVAKRVRPALNYYGSKSAICRRILQVAPPHRVYVESFAGGLSVLLNKYRSDVEVVCDVYPDLIQFYRVLVDHCEELIARVKEIRFEKASYLAACAAGNQGDDLTCAVNFLVRQRLSWSGGQGWADGAEKKVAAWVSLADDLRVVADRLKGVKIFRRSAFEVIPEYDSPETFFYCDPPYYSPTRVTPDVYSHELKAIDHVRLLRLLKAIKGSVVLSGYDHPLYNEELADWGRVEIEVVVRTSSGRGGKPSRTEILWVKPPEV